MTDRAGRRIDGVVEAAVRAVHAAGLPNLTWRGRGCKYGLAHLQDTHATSQSRDEQRRVESFKVRRVCEARIDWFEFAGGSQQERGRVAPAPGRERDLSSQQIHPGAPSVVDGACLRHSQESESVLERTGLILGLRGRQRALRA